MSTTLRVLVVDDEGAMRAVLHRIFLNAGLRVEIYDSALALLSGADLTSPRSFCWT